MAIEQGPPTAEDPWPVALLGAKLRDWIDRLGVAWVEGEITQWNVAGGNVYGKLKDIEVDATVSFSIWSSVRSRVPADLKQGARVVAAVKPNYWVKGGSLTMQVVEMKHVGLGDLLERLERLRRSLAEEGLFDPARKKRLPFLPHRIGLITGKDSDAEKDVKRNAQLRWPQVEFRTVHTAVQGDRAVAEVTAAIQELDADPEVDVIIVARGGGDFQNLLGFSDEGLVRAASAATTPIVSAIGHEADRPILDEVADLRASTPTDAAKRVVPDVAEELANVRQARARLGLRLSHTLSVEADRIAALRSRPALASTAWLVDTRAEEVARDLSRARELLDRQIERSHSEVGHLTGRLRALSPRDTLRRGYAIVQTSSGAVVRGADELDGATPVHVTLGTGTAVGTLEADGPGPDGSGADGSGPAGSGPDGSGS
ncbi:exodeoxyribonuclease VII large subunit [Curtobacterium sp. APC 4022]|uniref:exodeoxyribonuclease VII large subunit n=1 Tax=Curtobacterium sp. APC 4022 TaxID=3035201 RepID=UPI0025B30BD4|nr:exodeoxyribonuclease VII large subunit [Curtobacterium sp. APC 4022]MDN3479931.1 exodeoxyribonuclease VII large subunit [Curtobacterium sp. APC 4022]